MFSPLISCIVPTFNAARYVQEALGSIQAQTYRPLEIIVADDGSTDDTLTLARACVPDLCIVTQETAGPAATRNLGLDTVSGPFVAFLDADDLWHPEKLARQMARFQARPELEACITCAQLFWTADLQHEAEQYRDHPRAAPQPGYATTTLLARREVFQTVGRLDSTLWFADATDWFIRAAEVGTILELLPDVLTYHRMHPANLTRRRSEASRQEFLRVVHASLRRRRQQGQTDARPFAFPDMLPSNSR